MTQVAPISQQIWDMKYRLKRAGGHPVDKSIDDTWARVAAALAEPEKDKALWQQRFYEVMCDFRFLPAGRILSGAGSDRRVTLFNCFVMGDIPDDMSGIFDGLKEAALTMQQGGGIGYDFSTLRPKGAYVGGVGADASGPLSFMDVWDAMCRTIMSAGSRRGAMMAVLRCDHPDIESFIEAKREPGRLRMFNLSVLVTDAFMQAVKEDGDWDLRLDGTVYRTCKARDLWDKITRSTYAYAEPGVVFIDRINKANNLNYCETIHGTNPCVTADTWVMTSEGARQVSDLVGRKFGAVVDGTAHESDVNGFFPTGRKPVLRLETTAGHSLRLTSEHLVRRVVRQTRWSCETEWTPAGRLAVGDKLVLHDHRTLGPWAGRYDLGPEAGYLLGLLIGDGTLKKDAAILSVWPGEACVNGAMRPGVGAVMAEAERCARTMPHRTDFDGWFAVAGRGERRLKSAALFALAARMGLKQGAKTVTAEIEMGSSGFCAAMLRGLFDADGSVQGTTQKGVSVRLAQSDLALLRAVQRMLLRFGIVSAVYRERRPAGTRLLPDGRGGAADYAVKAQHELIVSRENLTVFAERIGFVDSEKSARLTSALAGYRRRLNREPFAAEIAAIEADGEEAVYDVQIPGVNAFDANGFYVHNCGEQPLPPYGACLLGSVNLARFVDRPFESTAELDTDSLAETVAVAVRLMDNVVDVSNFPLEAQRHEAAAKRRIGLGVTGLADALIMCGARYGSGAAVKLTEAWLAAIQRAAYLSSVEIAKEKGAFPLFDKEKYLSGEHIATLDKDVRDAIAEHGIRNALLTSVAPTGTISLFADNVSSGLEPVFSFSYTRNVLMPDGSRRAEEVSDYAYRLYRRLQGEDAPLTDAFVDAQQLAPNDHLVMQAAVQKYIDSSISKTINVPESISFDDFKQVYMEAYDLGCKGCTTYRPNDVTGAVLEVNKNDKAAGAAEPELPLGQAVATALPKDEGDSGAVVYMTQPLDRPEALPGATYKVNWPESDHAIYITLNDIVQDGRRRPFEVFINSKNMEHYAWTVGLTRMISAVFRRGGDVSFVVEELKAVFDPRGGQWMGGKYVPSLLAAIGGVIERHMIEIGFLTRPGELANEADKRLNVVGLPNAGSDEPANASGDGGGNANLSRAPFRQCPKCGDASLIRQEGCDTCASCGYSKCG